MAFAVAGLFAEGETRITGTECVNTSYPGFYETLRRVSAPRGDDNPLVLTLEGDASSALE
jgi:3-phosphoshikimate 1-carboxyvinyltransferase